MMTLLLMQMGSQQQFSGTQYTVQRRADFMAHISQEIALHARYLLRVAACFNQFSLGFLVCCHIDHTAKKSRLSFPVDNRYRLLQRD